MSNFPPYIQRALDLGLLLEKDGKLVETKEEVCEKVIQVARIVDKLQPTSVQEREDTTAQEAIILSRVLTSPSGLARERWSELRCVFGMAYGQVVPSSIWSDVRFRAVANEIDLTFIGERISQLITKESLITAYSNLSENSKHISILDFNKTISELSDPELMRSYGDPDLEWTTALDILKQYRVRALYLDTLHAAKQNIKADTKLEEALEFLQKRAMEGVGIMRGSIGNQGQSVEAVESIIGDPGSQRQNWIDRIATLNGTERPVSTGVPAFDLDIGGGVQKPRINSPCSGRLFTFAARTSVGKSAIGCHVATSLASHGLTVGIVSAELDYISIEARLFASLSRKLLAPHGYHWRATQDKIGYITVAELETPAYEQRDGIAALLAQLAMEMQNTGGKLLIEAPWGACVDAAINSLRSMKARHPEMSFAVLDHFHSLARHKGAPSGEPNMLEERAYKLLGAAKELGIDLLVLAQMNQVGLKSERDNRGEAPPPPQMDQIRGTDALSHVSHAMWLARRRRVVAGEPSDRKIEVWHSKVRGAQLFWEGVGGTQRMTPVKGLIEMSLIQIDYPTSSIKSDDTGQHPLILGSRRSGQ